MFFIGSDHAGYELKEKIKNYFRNIDWQDLGCHSTDRVDYPDFADQVCQSLIEDTNSEKSFALLICGSGQGMAMRANKYKEIRAALCWNQESAQLSRAHNNANVLCLGERLIEPNLAIEIVKVFFKTEFEGGRHQGRVDKINNEL